MRREARAGNTQIHANWIAQTKLFGEKKYRGIVALLQACYVREIVATKLIAEGGVNPMGNLSHIGVSIGRPAFWSTSFRADFCKITTA